MYAALDRFLANYIFRFVVMYIIFPFTILLDLLLVPFLIIFKDNLVIVLVANSYLNCLSVAVSSIILREEKQTNQPQIQALHEKHDALHEKHIHMMTLLRAIHPEAASQVDSET